MKVFPQSLYGGHIFGLHDGIHGISPVNWAIFITAHSTCTLSIREPWPTLADLLTEDEERRVEKLAEKTMDLFQLLVDILHVQAGKAPEGSVERTVTTRHDAGGAWGCCLRPALTPSPKPSDGGKS